MKYKMVLFDLDGTLIDSAEGITKCTQYALKRYGIDEPNLDKLRIFIGPPLKDTFMKYYGFTAEQGWEATLVYRERYDIKGKFECKLYPKVEECIRGLKNKGYLIGLASSKPEQACREILDYFKIGLLFDDIVGSSLDGTISNKEEVLNEVMRRWSNIPKQEMLLVGDTIYDINGANQVGMDSVAVSFGFGNITEMRQSGARAVIDQLDELVDLVDEL